MQFEKILTESKKYVWLLIIIPIFLCVFLRVQQFGLPIAHQWAAGTDYPNKIELENYIKSQMQDPNGYVYMTDIDSYYYYRQASEIVDHGYQGTSPSNLSHLKYGNVNFDGKKLYPIGSMAFINLLPYISAYSYKIINFVYPSITLMEVTKYIPIVFMVFAVIFAYLIGYILLNHLAGFVFSLFIAINPFILQRTLSPDTDFFNVFFPLLFILIIVIILKQVKKDG